MLNAEVLLPHDEMNGLATIVKQSVEDNKIQFGYWNYNPMLNTLAYECEFSDGTVK